MSKHKSYLAKHMSLSKGFRILADNVSKKIKRRIVVDQFSVLNRAAWSKRRFEFI
ncbi:MAG: hypothetical protein ACE5FH_08705 [Candidatus Zixiibacteriota bacterium]